MIDDDIYGDLENFNNEENINDLKTENGVLRDEVEILKEKIEDLTKENLLLQKNYKDYETKISSLLMTARSEVVRKDRLIADLNREKDVLVFRKFNRQNNFADSNLPRQVQMNKGQKRKLEAPEHDDEKKLKVNKCVIDNQQPGNFTTPNGDHNLNTSKVNDDKNCLKKLIIEMEKDNLSDRRNVSRVKLNRRKSMCESINKCNVRLDDVKHESDQPENITYPCEIETNKREGSQCSTIEDKYIKSEDKGRIENNENLSNIIKTEINGKKTVCDSTTDSRKGKINLSWIPRQEHENSDIEECWNKKKAFKIQRTRRQSMSEDIFRKRELSPEQPASIHHSRRNISRDDFHHRRARNASSDRHRDHRIDRDYQRDPHNASRDSHLDMRNGFHDSGPNSRNGCHDSQSYSRNSIYDSRHNPRNGLRRTDPRNATRVSRLDPRNVARASHSDPRKVTHESRPDPRYSSGDRYRNSRERQECFNRESERYVRNTSTRSRSKERCNVDRQSPNGSRHIPTSILIKRMDKESSNSREKESLDDKNDEDISNTLRLRYSDSEESNSNQNSEELDSDPKKIKSFDLRQHLLNKISNSDSNNTLSTEKTLSSTIKSENEDSLQCNLRSSCNDIYTYINNLSNQSTDHKATAHLDSLSIDDGMLAESAPTFHIYQDYTHNLPTSRDTIMSSDTHLEPQIAGPIENKKVHHFELKHKPITYIEYSVHKIDKKSSVNSVPPLETERTKVEAVVEVIPSANNNNTDPRQKHLAVEKLHIDSNELLKLSQNTIFKCDESIDEMIASDLIKYAACTGSSPQQVENVPNEPLPKEQEEKVSSNDIKSISASKSPRKFNNQYKIPKKQKNVKQNECSLNDQKGIPENEQRSVKKEDSHKKVKKTSEHCDTKISISKLESEHSESPDKKKKENKKSIELQYPQNSIAIDESIIAEKATGKKEIKQSCKITGASIYAITVDTNKKASGNDTTVDTNRRQSNNAKKVNAHKKESSNDITVDKHENNNGKIVDSQSKQYSNTKTINTQRKESSNDITVDIHKKESNNDVTGEPHKKDNNSAIIVDTHKKQSNNVITVDTHKKESNNDVTVEPHKKDSNSAVIVDTQKKQSNNGITVDTHKTKQSNNAIKLDTDKNLHKDATSSKNKTSKNNTKDKKLIVEITPKNKNNQEKIIDINLSNIGKTKQHNAIHLNINTSLVNMATTADKTLPSNTKTKINEVEVSLPNVSESGKEKCNIKKSTLKSPPRKECDQLRQNEEQISTVSGTVKKRRILYSYKDDSEDTTDLQKTHHIDKFGIEPEQGSFVDINHESCRQTLTPDHKVEQSLNTKKHHAIKDVKSLKSSRIKKRSRSVIVHRNDIVDEDTSNELSLLNVLNGSIKQITSKVDNNTKQAEALIPVNLPLESHIKGKESDLQLLIDSCSVMDTIKQSKLENVKIEEKNRIKDSPQCHNKEKSVIEREDFQRVLPKEVDNQLTVSQPTPSSSTDNKKMQSDEGNYVIQIRRKRKIVKTF